MAKTGRKQPDESRAFDIDLSNSLKRSTHTITSIISFVDNQDTSMTYTNETIISAKAIRVTMAGGVAGTYKVTVKVVTNYDEVAEIDFYIIVADT